MSDARLTEVTFEAGYEELKGIVARLDADDVTVHEMCELFARGKGLEQALRRYLTTQQSKLDEIEGGNNVPQFAIVAPSAPDEDARPRADRVAVPAGSSGPPATPSGVADDDIPF